MQTAAPITSTDLADMASHWLGCPVSGYLGQSYGADLNTPLQAPMASGLWDDLVAKFRNDVPLAQRAGPGSINVYSYDLDMDRKGIAMLVAGELVQVPGGTAGGAQ